MDILTAIGGNDLYTFHAHTQFCDGRADMEEFAQAAAKLGFRNLGFSPHSPIPIESPCNMKAEAVPAYFAEIERLAKEYTSVTFYAGMEIDYLGPDWGPAIPYFLDMPLDFRIGSIHFIPNQEGRYVDVDGRYAMFEEKMLNDFHGDIRYVVDTFFHNSIEMVRAGGFDIIGHFDKIKHNGGLYHPGLEEESWYKAGVNDLIDAIIQSGLIVEINTKAWKEHKQLFPAQYHWRRLLQAHVPIIVNSDAHFPSRLNEGRQQALAALNYLARQCKNN